jgi:hypothetical protein
MVGPAISIALFFIAAWSPTSRRLAPHLPGPRHAAGAVVDRASRRVDEPSVRAARAAVTMDIEPQELEAGVRLHYEQQGALIPELFLADAIENGAGFVTFLADPGRFAALLHDTRALIAEWEDPAEDTCGGSCRAACATTPTACSTRSSTGAWPPMRSTRC